MDVYLLDFVNVLLRWLHVVAAIAWIGESIYFVMLDNSLRPPSTQEGIRKKVFGDMWAVHGGGFYHNQKYLTNPTELPDDLHWSFWKAYATWLSGFALFATIYLLKPDFYLINPASPWEWATALTDTQARILAVLFLISGWIIYDQLCRRISPDMENDGMLSFAVTIMMIFVAWLSTQLFQGRAAFLITGAVMATAMSANVFFWIIPGQRRMVNALKAGEEPDPLDGKRGKQRSVHNTYFTLPVVLLMLSNHYAFLYASRYSWIIMSLFILSGALIRQYYVLRHAGKNHISYPVAGIALIVIVALLAAPWDNTTFNKDAAGSQETTQDNQPDIATIQQIVQARCIQCHAAKPTMSGFIAPPLGIALDSPEQIVMHADQIKQSVATQTMPLGNITLMTTAERDTVRRWRPQ